MDGQSDSKISFEAKNKWINRSGMISVAAAWMCLAGLFLHILISEPLLVAHQFRIAGEGGAFYEKIHPGSWLIFLSLVFLLTRLGNPLRDAARVLMLEPVLSAMLLIDILVYAYTIIRGGTAGTAFMIETHLTAATTAVVMAFVPVRTARQAILIFIALATLNSFIGIAESLGRFRIFSYDPSWSVMKEMSFRSSALLGHPLVNAIFTLLALFITADARLKLWLKLPAVAIMYISLIPFGGRTAFLFCTLSILFFCAIRAVDFYRKNSLTVMQTLLFAGATLILPIVFFSSIFVLLNTNMGDRLLHHAVWDESAGARVLALKALNLMTNEELIFGISHAQIDEIAVKIGLAIPTADIENPWLLLLMNFGAIFFVLWLLCTLAFVFRLLRGQTLGPMLAVIGYYVVASTENSFGRKDVNYMLMAGFILCVAAATNDALPPIVKRK